MSSDKAHVDADLRARREALDVMRSFIIQAPAGSGKTELLIQRYLSLLCVVDNPEEIIAITFTRKAAAEMQLRITAALKLAEKGTAPSADHERTTYEIARRAILRSKKLQWNVIANTRRLRILTMDALNASIVRHQPLSPGATSGRVVVDAELNDIHQKAAVATLDWLTVNGEQQAATKDVLQHVDNDTWRYANYLSQMLAGRDQWLPFIGSGLLSAAESESLRVRFEQSLDVAVTEHLQRTLELFGKVPCDGLPALLSFAADNLVAAGIESDEISALCGSAGLPAADSGSVLMWQGIARILLTAGGRFRQRVDKRQGFPTSGREQKEAIAELLIALADNDELATSLHGVLTLPPTRYSDEQWQVLLALFRLLPLAAVELRRLFAERRVVDHVERALLAHDALGTPDNPGDIALLLDYQVRHLLVDEMQDTSAAQYRLLETLVGGWQPDDGRSLCCVGDPMQSIYRFRNAEVGQFLFAQQRGIGTVKLDTLVLRRNFRSGEYLVDWFNAVFPDVLAKNDDPLRGAVAYAGAVSVPGLQGQGSCNVHPVFGTNHSDEADAACNLIANTLFDHPHDDMVLLVRSRTHLPALLANLRAAGVAYRAIEIDRLTDLPEIIDVLALTRAAAHQGDRIAWLGILRGPWIGLDWSDLHALVRNDSKSTVWELINDSERLSTLSAYATETLSSRLDILSLLVQPRPVQGLAELVERVWFELGGPGMLDDQYAVENIYRFFSVLGRLERAGTLVDVGELESILDQERVSNDDNARLQVMTMHKAKGLQFDHVLLYGLGRQPGRGDKRVLSWIDLLSSDDVERKIISPVGPQMTVDNDPVHRYIEKLEAEKDRQEQARLLYVACTRAKKSLHLMGNTSVSNDGDTIKPARNGSLLNLLWPAVEGEFLAAFDGEYSTREADAGPVWANPVLKRFETPWELPDAPPLSTVPEQASGTDGDSKVEFYWVGSEARIAGTLVHRWLQALVDDPSRIDHCSESDIFRQTTRRWLQEAGVGDKSIGPILERVEKAVSASLSDERGRWLLSGDGYAELALSGVHDNERVSVILDRVRIDDDGTHWIVDYKTSTHEGGDLAGFLQAETERYRPQLVRYAFIYSKWSGHTARCALYFPLLGRFVEVAV